MGKIDFKKADVWIFRALEIRFDDHLTMLIISEKVLDIIFEEFLLL